MSYLKYVIAISLIVPMVGHAAPLERVALPPVNPTAALKKDASAQRFFMVRTPYNSIIKAYDPTTGMRYTKQGKAFKAFPYYVVYDSAFGCFSNLDKIVEKVANGEDESLIDSPLNVIHMDHNQALNSVDGVSNLTPQCVYASNLAVNNRGIQGTYTKPVPLPPNTNANEITLTSENRQEILALPDAAPPERTQLWYELNR